MKLATFSMMKAWSRRPALGAEHRRIPASALGARPERTPGRDARWDQPVAPGLGPGARRGSTRGRGAFPGVASRFERRHVQHVAAWGEDELGAPA
jgi:hypothetical protein